MSPFLGWALGGGRAPALPLDSAVPVALCPPPVQEGLGLSEVRTRQGPSSTVGPPAAVVGGTPEQAFGPPPVGTNEGLEPWGQGSGNMVVAMPRGAEGSGAIRLAPTRPYSPPFPAEILQANDSLTQAINLYKQLVRGEEVNGEAVAAIPGEQRAERAVWGTVNMAGHGGALRGERQQPSVQPGGGSGAPSWPGRLQKCSWGAGEL